LIIFLILKIIAKLKKENKDEEISVQVRSSNSITWRNKRCFSS